MGITLKRADQVALGELVVLAPHSTGKVTRICRNPHFGCIGYELNDTDRFCGWFLPDQDVAVAERA